MYIKFLWSLLRHKWFVFLECCKLGIPLLGFIHDWSKFLPSEFIPYAQFFYGSAKPEANGAFDIAWNMHQKRNRHHWQYWLLTNDSDIPQVKRLPMPRRYRLEMLADWQGAGTAYGNPNTAEWYNEHKDRILLHPDTRQMIEADLW